MEKFKIIGISGLAGSGKSECSLSLQRNQRYTEIAFADKLKSMTSDLFDLPLDMLRAENKQKRAEREEPIVRLSRDGTPRSGRWLLQEMGNKIRMVYPDVWIEYVGHQIKRHVKNNGYGKFVVPDVRFNNELEFIRSLGGEVVEVVRDVPYWYGEVNGLMDPDEDTEWFLTSRDEYIHKSEWASQTETMQLAMHDIQNDSTIEDLHQRALEFERRHALGLPISTLHNFLR